MEDNKLAMRSDNIIEARYSLTNKQNVIIDMLLTEITDDDNVKYTLNVDKFEPLMEGGASNIYRDLKSAVKSFEGKGFRLVDKNTKEEVYFPWFSKIHYKPRKGEIDVKIDIEFKKVLYEVKKKIYYDIKYTMNMKSSYSQRFYYFLKSFEDTEWRYDKIEDLIVKLECPKSCNNFARFESSVLKKAYEEINNKTDINFEYETFKTGKKVTHIKSYIKSKNKIQSKCTQMTVEYILNSVGALINGVSDAKKILKALEEAKCDDKIEYFKTEVDKVMRYHKHRKDIPFIALILSALKNPWNNEKQEQLKFGSGFNNFEGRQYDHDAIEEMALGYLEYDESKLHKHD
ncbi:replication initiation protein [Clostridium sp. 1001283B150210_160208_E6]|jgi:plasmid replication initiation protein|uniref:replication initiation protein n=1 Tax=Clostridium sp. 1001283B150210_160208_E6 TaxID=2787129 RepID=UPI0018AAD7E9|nr:replication initiation protein [Clostridium sp. 1001283B150210_160208_E6]